MTIQHTSNFIKMIRCPVDNLYCIYEHFEQKHLAADNACISSVVLCEINKYSGLIILSKFILKYWLVFLYTVTV